MIDADLLLADGKKQVVVLVDDLRAVAATDPNASAYVAAEYQRAHAAGRTAFGQAEWAEGLYAQVAVAWVLGCVFVRFCEDNGLIVDPLLGGPGIRSQIALDHRAAHLQANPAHDDRHWLRAVFGRVRALPATGDIFGGHNPVWADGLLPSADGARKLREELTRLDPETGELRHDFTDPAWDTRFLGDLYQDLSEHAKKTYALLQTPIFVEEFILDRTLEPAISTFGLADTTIIDPTCGSGHFLLGAFARLFDRWVDTEPSTNRRELARRVLAAIGGIDLNPFAASIARFRLLVAALRAGGDALLADAPAYEIHIAVGDSLLHGDPPGQLPDMHTPGEEEALVGNHGYESEDIEEVRVLLRRCWTAVVGNPPYITVKDPALNAAYRARFSTCHRSYSLGVPFTERFWQLAGAHPDPDQAGYIGLITANSFMKREFGKKLIEQWVPANDLSHVIDTNGAYIPGHGTPTVILLGRNRAPVSATVRAVMGIRGEPARPDDPEKGLVWSSIVELVDQPGTQNEFISVADLARARLCTHPWSIGGGGAAELLERLNDSAVERLRDAVAVIGAGALTREDDVFRIGLRAALRAGIPRDLVRAHVAGDDVRDWRASASLHSICPYDPDGQAVRSLHVERFLWPWRAQLSQRVAFGKTQVERGLHWWEYSMLFRERFLRSCGFAFADVATHNHAAWLSPDSVFKETAPVVIFADSTPRSRVHGVMGAFASSAGNFWVRQVCHDKGNRGEGGGITSAAWERFIARDSTKVGAFPLPSLLPGEVSESLVSLAARLNDLRPSSTAASSGALAIPDQGDQFQHVLTSMIAAQERLDWECYRLYGLVTEDLTTGQAPEPSLQLGERAFEIVLARRLAAGEDESSWFVRHGSTPITDLPSHWSPEYRRLVERRIELIETDLNIGLIERPEFKRRWVTKPWDEQVRAALEAWLLDRLEDQRYWPEPAAITTIARLTAEARADADFVSAARLYAGRDDIELAALVKELVKGESVAYLAAHRYTDSGFRKHADWLKVWDLQRRDDAGEDIGAIPVPPKYGKSDFNGAGWEHRGKLDVPTERFINYPGAERETDASMVVGWAGWNHLDRARALAAWYLQARRDGRDPAHLVPLLAGLAELVPWLKQWYDEPNADPALDRPGTQIAALLDTELRSLGLTATDLAAWRPVTKRSGRAKKAAG